jgi:hypothetical protein
MRTKYFYPFHLLLLSPSLHALNVSPLLFPPCFC